MNSDNITSNFKLFSKSGEATNASSPISYASIIQNMGVLIFVLLFGVIAYYRREDIQQFYDVHLRIWVSNWISRLWVATHLNSKGELASTHVPSGFSLTKWLPFSVGEVVAANE